MKAFLEQHGVKPTPNRLLIARALEEAGAPLSLLELEARVESIDKSNIFRTLNTFRKAHLVHVLEGEVVRYELCHSSHEDHDDDLHVHFYCVVCHKTICLEDTPVPSVKVPQGYRPQALSYLVKGVCPQCGG